MPVFSDWEVASALCRSIDREFGKLSQVSARVLLVDDGNPEGTRGWAPFEPQHITTIDVLHLRRNMGHQRAIAMGLCVIHEQMDCEAVIIMDADGEDRPETIGSLLEQFRRAPDTLIFAERRRRYANVFFRAGYWSYRILHRILTGISVRVGNFSIAPRSSLARLVGMSELWNHYSGAVYKSKLKYTKIPADRGVRLGGTSHMNLVELVVHGLSGIATFYDVAATRILIASLFFALILVIGIAVVVAIRLATNWAIPGWATFTAGLLFVLLMQFASISFSLVFSLITTRLNMTFVPVRDYRIFVEGIEMLCVKGGHAKV